MYHAKEHEKESERRLGLQKQEYESTIKRHLSFIDQVCLSVYMRICLFVYISVCVCVHPCKCTCVCMHVRVCVCVHINKISSTVN